MKNLESISNNLDFLSQFNLLANQVVEGFISGIHKSPFHGFSSEFAEHKMYNLGENTKNIDWKIYAKTDKLYTKKYDDETNLRCHIIMDNSASMHYPKNNSQSFPNNKIQYSCLFAAAILKIIKKQRDAAGLTIFSNQIDFQTKELGNEKHHRLLIQKLNETYVNTPIKQQTAIIDTLHEVAKNIHKRSMIMLFSDMLQSKSETEKLIEALQHLKYNKHKVVLFHVHDKKTELDFNFNNDAKKFVDVETGETINLYADQVQEKYKEEIEKYFKEIETTCQHYKIDYHLVDINENIEKKIILYLTERQKFK